METVNYIFFTVQYNFNITLPRLEEINRAKGRMGIIEYLVVEAVAIYIQYITVCFPCHVWHVEHLGESKTVRCFLHHGHVGETSGKPWSPRVSRDMVETSRLYGNCLQGCHLSYVIWFGLHRFQSKSVTYTMMRNTVLLLVDSEG